MRLLYRYEAVGQVFATCLLLPACYCLQINLWISSIGLVCTTFFQVSRQAGRR